MVNHRRPFPYFFSGRGGGGGCTQKKRGFRWYLACVQTSPAGGYMQQNIFKGSLFQAFR